MTYKRHIKDVRKTYKRSTKEVQKAYNRCTQDVKKMYKRCTKTCKRCAKDKAEQYATTHQTLQVKDLPVEALLP